MLLLSISSTARALLPLRNVASCHPSGDAMGARFQGVLVKDCSPSFGAMRG